MRTHGTNRITAPLPLEFEPLVDEINALLAHTEQQAEEARMHAGNLAHALKTPLTVLTNAATAHDPRLSEESELDPEFSEKFLRFIIDEVIRHHERAAGR